MRFPLTTALAALTLTATSNAIPTIAAKGSKFFTSDGKQWYIKGMCLACTKVSTTLTGHQVLPINPLGTTRLRTRCNVLWTPR